MGKLVHHNFPILSLQPPPPSTNLCSINDNTIAFVYFYFRWCRVIILSLLQSQAVVHFVDYGNMEEVCIDELQTMPRELTYLPSQAIECKLAHIKPSGKFFIDTNIIWIFKTKSLHKEIIFVMDRH